MGWGAWGTSGGATGGASDWGGWGRTAPHKPSESDPLKRLGEGAKAAAIGPLRAIDAVLGAPERLVEGTVGSEGDVLHRAGHGVYEAFHPNDTATREANLERTQKRLGLGERPKGTDFGTGVENFARDTAVQTILDPLTYLPFLGEGRLAERALLGSAEALHRVTPPPVKAVAGRVASYFKSNPELDGILENKGADKYNGIYASERGRMAVQQNHDELLAQRSAKANAAGTLTQDQKDRLLAEPWLYGDAEMRKEAEALGFDAAAQQRTIARGLVPAEEFVKFREAPASTLPKYHLREEYEPMFRSGPQPATPGASPFTTMNVPRHTKATFAMAREGEGGEQEMTLADRVKRRLALGRAVNFERSVDQRMIDELIKPNAAGNAENFQRIRESILNKSKAPLSDERLRELYDDVYLHHTDTSAPSVLREHVKGEDEHVGIARVLGDDNVDHPVSFTDFKHRFAQAADPETQEALRILEQQERVAPGELIKDPTKFKAMLEAPRKELAGVPELRGITNLYRQALFINPLPHMLNIARLTYLAGGPGTVARGLGKFARGDVGRETGERLGEVVGTPMYLAGGDRAITDKIPGVRGLRAWGQGKLTEFDRAMRAAYLEELDRSMGPTARKSAEEYAKGAEVRRGIGGYEERPEYVQALERIGAPFANWRLNVVPQAVGRAAVRAPHRVERYARGLETANQDIAPATGGQIELGGPEEDFGRLVASIGTFFTNQGSRYLTSPSTIGPISSLIPRSYSVQTLQQRLEDLARSYLPGAGLAEELLKFSPYKEGENRWVNAALSLLGGYTKAPAKGGAAAHTTGGWGSW